MTLRCAAKRLTQGERGFRNRPTQQGKIHMTIFRIKIMVVAVSIFFPSIASSTEYDPVKDGANKPAGVVSSSRSVGTPPQALVQALPPINQPTLFETDRIPLEQELVDLSLAIAPKEVEGIVYRLRNIEGKEPICLLLVGAPGTGKTTLAQSIAQTTGRHFGLIRASLLADQYQFSAQTHLKQEIAHFVQSDPYAVICIDEIDELRGYKDQPSAFKALCTIIDDCGNLSPHVIFIATTNDKNIIPDALMSRFGGRVLNVVSQDISARVQVMHHYAQQIANEKVNVALDDQFYLRFAKKTHKLSLRDIKKIFDVAVDFACARTWRNFLEPEKGQNFVQRLLNRGEKSELDEQDKVGDMVVVIEQDLNDALRSVLRDVHARTYAKIRQFSHEYGSWVFPMAASSVLGIVQIAITLTHFQMQSKQSKQFHYDQIGRTDIQIAQTKAGQEQAERHFDCNMAQQEKGLAQARELNDKNQAQAALFHKEQIDVSNEGKIQARQLHDESMVQAQQNFNATFKQAAEGQQAQKAQFEESQKTVKKQMQQTESIAIGNAFLTAAGIGVSAVAAGAAASALAPALAVGACGIALFAGVRAAWGGSCGQGDEKVQQNPTM